MSRAQKRSLLRIAAAAVLLIGLHFVPVTGWLKLVLYLIPYLLVGGETLVDACKGIYNRQPFDENLLMAVATVGAMVLGDYPEAVSVMLFYQIGELFESYAVGRSRKNIGDLMDIRPDFAYVETADGIVRVKPEEVAVGDTIVVKPGERVPLDGTVLTGTSALNMSALTGESAPVDVAEGSGVVSGSVNLSGVLRLRVEKVYAESTVARILELVENSSLKKAHTERFITKFARVYTPSVCGAALALAILPPVVRLIMGIPADWGEWIYRALTFLVISCPCALVISIPLSFFGGIGGASARGILIKGSSCWPKRTASSLTRPARSRAARSPSRRCAPRSRSCPGRRCCSLQQRRSGSPTTPSARACAAQPDSCRRRWPRRTPESSPVTA